MTTAVIIVAAGRGLRAGGPEPKQWQMLRGQRVIDRTIAAFAGVGPIVVVLAPNEMQRAETLTGCRAVAGGATRAASVRAGLEALESEAPDLVLIHDAARPLVSHTVIGDVIGALAANPAAAPALAVTDALWKGESGEVSGVQDRTGLFRAQTPQGFDFSAILDAHRAASDAEAADDVAIARAAGLSVATTRGDERNLKITTPEDFTRAEQLLESQMDIRTGNGFDVHKFGPGDHVWLCGVKVPHTHALVGHSDADVGMHAVTDAIYGALGRGDIGQHFPPSDPQWKGAASHIFLEHAVALAREHGFAISNVDCTLICELPKIGPHADDMRRVMARFLGIEEARVSVKATTSEGLGFTGRKEGIACLATASLVRS